jgi:hypothetical protein
LRCFQGFQQILAGFYPGLAKPKKSRDAIWVFLKNLDLTNKTHGFFIKPMGFFNSMICDKSEAPWSSSASSSLSLEMLFASQMAFTVN